MESKYFLYRHIRLDKNEPFYIGIGTKSNRNHPNERSEFRRAYCTTKRSSFWYKIVNKTDFYVEIMLESNDYNFIKEKEIEFINLYGRKNLNQGTLVNLTDGGEGNKNRVISDEWRKGHSLKMKGRHHSEDAKERIRINGAWYKTHPSYVREKISKAQKGRKKSKEHLEKLFRGQILANSKPVLQYDIRGNFIREWFSATTVQREININATAIRNCIKGLVNHAGHFIWKEKTNNEVEKKIILNEKLISLGKYWEIKDRLARGINKNKIKTKIIDTFNNDEIIFNTAKEAAEYLNIHPSNFNSIIKKSNFIKNRYKIIKPYF